MLIERGRGLLAAGRLWEAISAFDAAEKAGESADECSAGRWHCYMLLGRFERAWGESDAICARNAPDPYRLWDGEPFTGRRVMIRCLHGLGDALQFLRYAPLVGRLADWVGVQTAPELLELAAGIRNVDRAMTWTTLNHPEPDWDQQIEVMELPRAFRTTIDTIPLNLPYFDLKRCLVKPAQHISPRSHGRMKVGLLWSASDWNPARSIPFQRLLRLLETPGIQFFSLQIGGAAKDRPEASGILDATTPGDTIAATTAKVRSLDLVVTVDTMMAHLAGTLGIPVWVMLPYEADWRWMVATDRSPWYPSMRLFRQASPGDWHSVTDKIEPALGAMASNFLCGSPA